MRARSFKLRTLCISYEAIRIDIPGCRHLAAFSAITHTTKAHLRKLADARSEGYAKRSRSGVRLPVLALLACELTQGLPCELSSLMQTVCERMSGMKCNEVERNEVNE